MDWELVGAHGVGKSTLMRTPAAEACRRGLQVVCWTCSGTQSRLPRGWRRALRTAQICCLDGGERCLAPDFRALRRQCSRQRIGLMVSLHETMGLGPSRQVVVVPEIFDKLVMRLAAAGGCHIRPGLPAVLLERRKGCAREALADLYYAFEDGQLD